MSLLSQPVIALRALTKAILAFALAALLLVGPPVVLIRFVGNPFPTVVPSWDDVSYAVTNGQIDSWTWIKALALIGWTAWANLVVGFVIELAAAARGARVRALRGLGATQWFASRVVAQCSLAGTLLFQSTIGVTAVGGLPPLPLISAPFSAPAAPDLGPSSSSASPAPVLSIDVGRRDTLWGLAETHFGDGSHWVAIRDANVGRTMADGTVLAPNFTRVIRGWTLVIPPRSPGDKSVISGHLATGPVEVERGDNLWELSTERLESAHQEADNGEVLRYLEEVVAHNDQLIDDPDLIYPGQVFTFPELGEPGEPAGLSEIDPSSTRTSAAGAATSAPAFAGRGHGGAGRQVDAPLDDTDVDRSTDDDRTVESGPDGPLERVALIGVGAAGALLAAGARRTLLRRRRYALAHRKPGTVPRPPSPELEQIERALHRQADDDAVRWLEAAMGSLATRPIWAGEHVAQPVGVTWRKEYLDVEFTAADPMAAPLPWITHDGGRHWLLPRGTAIKDLPTAGPDDPAPAMITIGLGRLLNLEGVGLFAVSGGDDRPMDVVRSIVHELATSTSAGTIDVRTTLPIDGIEGYDLVQVQSPVSLSEELVPWLEDLAPRLDEALSTNAFAYRIVSEDEPMAPVVLITDEQGFAGMSALATLARRRTLPLAMVVVGGVDAEFSIELSEQVAVLKPWDEVIEPQLLNAAAARQLGDLLLSALSSGEDPLVAGVQLSAPVTAMPRQSAPDGSTLELVPIASGQERDRSPRPVASGRPDVGRQADGATASPRSVDPSAAGSPDDGSTASPRSVDPSAAGSPDDGSTASADTRGDTAQSDEADQLRGPTVVVRVLGDVEVDGVGSELTSQQLSLLTYLACHGPSSRESIVDALWDGQVISRSRFPNLLAELRSRLGRHHLPEARDARYQLTGVTTDLAEFERRVGLANKQPPQEAVVTLRAAMDAVRGVPLTPPGRRFWSWVGDETYLAARVEALVADTAARLARIEQELGHLDGAQNACEQGLRASPTDETLVVVLTEVYMMQGKPGLARRLVERWEDKISRLECGEPSEEPRKRLAG